MTHEPDLITVAARAMTDIEPPHDLEARIRQRLDAHTLTPPMSRRWPIAAGLAAVGAAVIILVMQSPDVTKSRGPEVPGSRGPVVRGEVAGLRSPAVPQPARVPHVEPRDRETTAQRNPAVNRGTSGPRDRGTSVAELAWMSRSIPALDVIDPLAMDRLSVDSIQPAVMSITPLTITPLGTSPVVGDPDTGRQQ